MVNLNPSEKFLKEGLTFDDVLLIPAKSDILPNETNIRSRLAGNIWINTPFVAAAMDTVTESRMAIAIAREGGIGIIHKNMSVEEQVAEIDKVKRWENGIVFNPISLTPDHYVYEAYDLMNNYKISGVPVVENGKLVGIVTSRDLKFLSDYNVKIKEIMTKDELVVGHIGTTLAEAQDILRKHKIEKLPLVDNEGQLRGLITIRDINESAQFPNSSKDSKGRLLCGAALGVTADVLTRAQALIDAQADVLVLDSAHGHTKGILECAVKIKDAFPNIPLIAGNVSTAQGTLDLIKAGVDAVKVGMGPGSICTTRIIAGIGVPQITAVYDASSAAAKYDIPVIADGGIKYSGDLVKAFAAGASTIMLGSILAGCDESPSEMELVGGRPYKYYRGMGSIGAMRQGSGDRYFQGGQNKKLVPEGIEARVPYKGPLSDTLFQLIGGLRAGMGYCGCPTIEDLQSKAQFVKITGAGLVESHPHDVSLAKESPNYSMN